MNIGEIANAHGISPDEVRMRWLALRVARWKSDFLLFARECVQIRVKSGDLEKLEINDAQKILHEGAEKQLREEGWVRIAGLKGRRQGFSTYVAARGYWRATLWDRQKIYILSHEMASSNVLFDMVGLMQEKNPFPPQVGTDNAKELEFVKRGSSYTVATAGQKAGGRGGAITFFHGSEAAWWTNAPDHFAASVQGVDEVRGVWGVLWTRPANPLPFERPYDKIEGWVKPPSEIWLETTSAGPTGEFWKRYTDAMKGIGRYRAIFVPWTIQPEYNEQGQFVAENEPDEDGGIAEAEYQQIYKLTDNQMLWRRAKIHELGSIGKFRQEFPIDVTEAFSAADTDGTFIKASIVLRARKRQIDTPDAPLIIGVDPAGAGGDRFAIAYRRGDKCLKIEHRIGVEHDDAIAWLSNILDEHKPARMVIDRGAMGQSIISSLRNINPQYQEIIKGCDFGGKSKAKMAQPNRAGPFNRRAEIYTKLRDWLLEGGAIPDDDDLASDISGPKIKYRANNDYILESKSDMKSRGLRSCDLSDALALTFGVEGWIDNWESPKIEKSWGTGSNISRLNYQDSTSESTYSSSGGWMI